MAYDTSQLNSSTTEFYSALDPTSALNNVKGKITVVTGPGFASEEEAQDYVNKINNGDETNPDIPTGAQSLVAELVTLYGLLVVLIRWIIYGHP